MVNFKGEKNEIRGSLMADRSVLCCEELSSISQQVSFALRQALTRPPPENTTCPGFTLGRSCRVTSPGSSLMTVEELNVNILILLTLNQTNQKRYIGVMNKTGL